MHCGAVPFNETKQWECKYMQNGPTLSVLSAMNGISTHSLVYGLYGFPLTGFAALKNLS